MTGGADPAPPAWPGGENQDVPEPSPPAGRHETPLERLDRNTVELLNELRVAGTGIQVLFGFLLIGPFNARFGRLSQFERDVYLVALVCIAVSTVLLIAPTVMHRLVFRQGQKRFLVTIGTRLMVIASGFLGVGMTAIVLLVSDLVAGALAAAIIASVVAMLIVALWFVVPLLYRRAAADESAEQG